MYIDKQTAKDLLIIANQANRGEFDFEVAVRKITNRLAYHNQIVKSEFIEEMLEYCDLNPNASVWDFIYSQKTKLKNENSSPR